MTGFVRVVEDDDRHRLDRPADVVDVDVETKLAEDPRQVEATRS